MPAAEHAPRPTQHQRDEAVRLIDAALADGQLDSAEHLDRLARVRDATQARQVAWALLDLQRPAPAPPTRRERWRSWWVGLPRGERISAFALVALLVLLVGLYALAVALEDDERDDGPSYAAIARDQTSVERITAFTEAYEKEFGTTKTGGVQLAEDSVQALVPVDGAARRYETWYLQNDAFNDYGTATAGDLQVDLAAIDRAAAAQNLRVAWRELGVEDPSGISILIGASVGPDGVVQERITYVVSNTFGESGRLETDLAGGELSRDPFEPPSADR